MELSKFIKEELAYGIYWLIPYGDLDILGVLYGTLGWDTVGHLPYVEEIDIRQLSWSKRIILLVLIAIPYADLEGLKFLRINKIGPLNVVTSKAKKLGEHEVAQKGKRAGKRLYQEEGEEVRESLKNQSQNQQNKWNENGNKVMADGGQNENRYQRNLRRNSGSGLNSGNVGNRGNSGGEWNDLQVDNDDDGSFISLPVSLSLGKFLKWGGIIGVLIIGGFLVMSLLGSGSGYLDFLGNALGSEATTVRETAGDAGGGIGGLISSGVSSVTCLTNPGCAQESLLNRSAGVQQPSSEQSGQTFRLSVSNPTVKGPGNSIDVANYEPDYEIPISFTLENNRQGRYGINASNIEYRVSMFDPGLADSEEVCSTDWLRLEKGGGVYGEEGVSGEGDLLVPGESATPLQWQEKNDGSISLSNCGLLQPDGGLDDREFRIDVRYDYFTTASLTPRAMSRQHMNNQNIDNTEGATSEAPDTPVRSYFRLRREPLFFRNLDGEREPQAETADLGIKTEKENIAYKLEDFTLQDSSRTEHVDGNCEQLENTEDNTYEIASDKRNSIKESQNEEWLGQQTSSVTQMNCQFRLDEDNIDSISTTGEELVFTVESSYRVQSTKERNQFNIINSRCSRNNCQMLKPLSGSFETALTTEDTQSQEFKNKEYATCNDWDDEEGCSVLKNGFSTNPELADTTIEDGDIAVNIEALTNNIPSAVSCTVQTDETPKYAGIDKNDLESSLKENRQVLNYSNGSWTDIRVEEVICD